MPRPGITIAIFETSSPSTQDAMDEAEAIIARELPALTLVPQTCGSPAPFPYLAGSDNAQALAFSQLMARPDIDAIWAVRGGYGALRWAGKIQWPVFRPPLLIGFSDVTVLHSCYVRHGFPSLHAPLITTLSRSSEETRRSLRIFLAQGTLPMLTGAPCSPGTVRGRLVGGNLTCLTHLVGTDLAPTWEDAILFLEDTNEAPYRIDRMMTHLLLSGRLSRIRGVALGTFSDDSREQKTVTEVILERLSPLCIPIVTDLPCGHGPENHPLLLGGDYVLDGTTGKLIPMSALARQG